MNIVLTGSSGFVGSYLSRKLHSLEHNIIKLDISEGVDITDWTTVKNLPKFDTCVHLAAKLFVPESYIDARMFYHVNVIGTLNMLELCKIHNAKMIFTSSYVYGKPNYLPIDEKHKLSAFNPYAHSKIVGEQLCENYTKFFGTPIIIFRPFNVYGYGQSKNFLVPEVLEKSTISEVIELLDASPKRDMVYVEDLVDAYICAIESNIKNEIFNIGSGLSYSVEQIVQLVFKNLANNNSVLFSNKERVNEVDDVIADISKVKRLLNWQPKTVIEDGIYKTVKLFNERRKNK